MKLQTKEGDVLEGDVEEIVQYQMLFSQRIATPTKTPLRATLRIEEKEGKPKKSYYVPRKKKFERFTKEEKKLIMDAYHNPKNFTPTGKISTKALKKLCRDLGRKKVGSVKQVANRLLKDGKIPDRTSRTTLRQNRKGMIRKHAKVPADPTDIRVINRVVANGGVKEEDVIEKLSRDLRIKNNVIQTIVLMLKETKALTHGDLYMYAGMSDKFRDANFRERVITDILWFSDNIEKKFNFPGKIQKINDHLEVRS